MESKDEGSGPFRLYFESLKGWAKWLLVLLGLPIFLAAMWGIYCLHENSTGRQAWEEAKAELTAQGEKLDWASFVPEPVPDELNFAATPLIESVGYKGNSGGRAYQTIQSFPVTDLVKSLAEVKTAKRSDFNAMAEFIRTNLAPGRVFASTNSTAVLIEWFGPMEATFDELRMAGDRPYSQFRFSKSDPEAGVPNFVTARELSRQLALLAAAHLEIGSPDLALAEVRAILAYARGIENYPLLVSLMIGAALDDLALQPVWEGLVTRRWREGELIELDRLLSRIDFQEGYQSVMRGERAALNAMIENRTPATFQPGGSAGPWVELRKSLEVRLAPRGWTWHGMAAFNRLIQGSIDGLYDPEARVINTDRLVEVEGELAFLSEVKSPRMRVPALVIPNFTRAYESLAETQTRVQLCRIAIAIERYRLRHDRLPEELNLLVPGFIDPLPHDLIGGGPLNHRRISDERFVLWSVGWNGVDEDAEASTKRGEGDWVWRSWGGE